MNPRRRAAILQQRRSHHLTSNADAYAFFNLLTGPELFEQVDSLLPDHRERLFPPTETLPMFMAQALSADRSCQRAVNELAIKQLVHTPAATAVPVNACRWRWFPVWYVTLAT